MVLLQQGSMMCLGWDRGQLVWVTDGVIQDCASPWCWTSDSTGTCVASLARQPPLALAEYFFCGGIAALPQVCPMRCIYRYDVRISTAAWNRPKMSPPEHWACKKAPLQSFLARSVLRFMKDLLSSAALKYELGFKWECSGACSWFVIISHLQT